MSAATIDAIAAIRCCLTPLFFFSLAPLRHYFILPPLPTPYATLLIDFHYHFLSFISMPLVFDMLLADTLSIFRCFRLTLSFTPFFAFAAFAASLPLLSLFSYCCHDAAWRCRFHYAILID